MAKSITLLIVVSKAGPGSSARGAANAAEKDAENQAKRNNNELSVSGFMGMKVDGTSET